MESCDWSTKAVIRMPEMVSRIIFYLSISDLLSCTGVNSIWEGEARKYLLKYSTTPICCRKVRQYFDTMRHGGLHHAHIKLITCHRMNCLATLVNTLRKENCLQNVTSLATDFARDVIRDQDFKLWALFVNLTTFEVLSCFCQEIAELGIHDIQRYFRLPAQAYFRYPGKRLAFPSVQKMIWHLPKVFEDDLELLGDAQNVIGSAGLLIFPNVTDLKFKFRSNNLSKIADIYKRVTGFPQVVKERAPVVYYSLICLRVCCSLSSDSKFLHFCEGIALAKMIFGAIIYLIRKFR